MTSATEVLRRLLDERGVEWGNIRNDGSESDYLTEWQFENNQGKAIAIEWAVGSGLSVEIHRYHLAPEQAIAATLGATDANPTQEESSGTCHDIGTFKSWGFFTCSNCSIVIPLDAVKDAPSIGRVIPPKYCPNCGAKVVEPTTNDVDVEEDE